MKSRTFGIIGGSSYLIIFFAAIYANFFVLESILASPEEMIEKNPFTVRLGILAFLITVVFDVIVAWVLYELYRKQVWTMLSTLFRMIHAIIMGVAVFTLPMVFQADTAEEILYQIDLFNIIWLIGLFFFGFHLILLGKIIGRPKIIGVLLIFAGLMYIVDTTAYLLLSNYKFYANLFLILVAVPSILGEMSFAVWLLIHGGKSASEEAKE